MDRTVAQTEVWSKKDIENILAALLAASPEWSDALAAVALALGIREFGIREFPSEPLAGYLASAEG